ncbi:phage tail tip fiber protein [Aeromonas caviae]
MDGESQCRSDLFGFGLIAKSDGTSQVAISASQVFVFNPNSSTPMAPLFAIDNGQAVIAEAIIRKATIQILTSEKITADYIKAGVSMSAPAISGGSINMGNAFLSGGAAGFGKGGPYASWGFGWYTMIYADGSIYTNRLRAEGGYVKNMTMNNCTIEQDCEVKGTVYAQKIVGDIVRTYALNPASPVQLPAMPFARKCTFMLTVSSGSSTTTARVYINGVERGSLTARDYGIGQGSTMNKNFEFLLAANQAYTISYDRDNKDYAYASSSCLSIVCLA